MDSHCISYMFLFFQGYINFCLDLLLHLDFRPSELMTSLWPEASGSRLIPSLSPKCPHWLTMNLACRVCELVTNFDLQRKGLSLCPSLTFPSHYNNLVFNPIWWEIEWISITGTVNQPRFPGAAWHSCRLCKNNDTQTFTLNFAFWPIESLTRIDKHSSFVNQRQAMTHLRLDFGPGEPMTSSAWVSAHVWPSSPRISILKKTLCQILSAGRYC